MCVCWLSACYLSLPVCVSVYFCVCLFGCLPYDRLVNVFVYFLVYLFVFCLFTLLFVCVFVCLLFCLSVCLSVCLFACLSVSTMFIRTIAMTSDISVVFVNAYDAFIIAIVTVTV